MLQLLVFREKSIFEVASGTLIPVLILFPLFYCRMLGTGDIKVFAVVGSVLGAEYGLYCIAISFVLGAAVALPILVFRCDARERFTYFFTYLCNAIQTKTFPPYLVPGKRPENIHFTIMIFCSVILLGIVRTGGFYE